MNTALARVGGDHELLRELAGLFIDECPRLLRDIGAALASGDAFKLKCVAHNLKGSIDSFAAKDAYDAALTLELAGRSGNLADAVRGYAILKQEVELLKQSLLAFARE